MVAKRVAAGKLIVWIDGIQVFERRGRVQSAGRAVGDKLVPGVGVEPT